MKINHKVIQDAGVSSGYEKGLTIDTHSNGKETYYIREPKSHSGTNGTYAVTETGSISYTNGIANNLPSYHFSGIKGNTNK
jgi:hypothetical protein